MNVSKELEEVGDMQFKLKGTVDSILDLYKKNPNKCKKLLIELSEIEKDLEELEEDFKKLQYEIC
jgi:predicted  nucleic acid-binding Zn-ribbon protein